MKWIEEIKAVGIKDWLWFTFYLGRNEFSERLRISKYVNLNLPGFLDTERCCRDRSRAHRIDNVISEVRSINPDDLRKNQRRH